MEYKVAKLGDICEINSGGTPLRSKEEYWKNGNIAWIKISDFNGKYLNNASEYITEQGLLKSSAKLFKKGTVLYTIFATLGEVSILNIDATTNQAIAGLVPNDEVNNNYLYYFLKSKKEEVNNIGRGVAQNNINLTILRNMDISLPSLQTQKKIVEVLDKAQELIDKRKEQIEALDELVKSRFIEMFGDAVKNTKGWRIEKLQNISSVGSGKRVFVEELVDNGIPFYRGTEIGALSTGENIEPTLFITEEHYKSLKESTGVPVVGDLLMPSICPDGRIWRVETEKPFYFKDGRVLWIHLDEQDIDSIYLKYMLREKFIRDYNKIASGTTFAELKIFALKSLDIMMPPIELQNQFADFVNQIDKLKHQMETSLKELEDNFNSLMQKAFKGELF